MQDNIEKPSRVILFLSMAFMILGFTVGHVAGLSDAEVTVPILTGLLAITGGSIVAFLKNISTKDRRIAAAAIICLSVGIIVGIHSSLWLRGAFNGGHIKKPTYGIMRSDEISLVDDFIRNRNINWSDSELKKNILALIYKIRKSEK